MTSCYLHKDREATRPLNIPCAPDGKLWVCDECHGAAMDSVLRRRLFEKYFAAHSDHIVAKSVENILRRGENQ